MKRDLRKLTDLAPEEFGPLFALTARLKADLKAGRPHRTLDGRSVGLLFRKSSTRTRISFEVGTHQLGAHPVDLDANRLQLGRGETLADTAKIFSRYLDLLVVRTYGQEEVEALAAEASIPVINALTDAYHPCQILADLFTIIEKRGSLDGVKVAYVGDGNNMAHSWLLGAALTGVDFSVAAPEGYEPDPAVVAEAKALAEKSGSTLAVVRDPAEAVAGAHVLYTDVWVSMGQDEERDARLAAFAGYCIDAPLVAKAAPDALVMHCLPAHRGEEIAASVIDGPRSVVWDEAENRLHVQKALMTFLINGF